jgi:AbrB family looped-hinge helix DNA binding protein
MKRAFSRVSSKGQLVIPAAIRAKYGIEAGTKVEFVEEGPRLLLEPETVALKLQKLRELRGMTAGGPSMADALIEERRLERERELREEGW